MKPFWILLKQEMMGWQWHQLNHMQVIHTLLQTDNHASTSSLKFFMDHMLFLPPNQQRQSTEGLCTSTASCGNKSITTDGVVGMIADLLVEFASVEHQKVVARLQNAALGRNRPRRVHVVARHHAHCDARALALADCIRNLTQIPAGHLIQQQ